MTVLALDTKTKKLNHRPEAALARTRGSITFAEGGVELLHSYPAKKQENGNYAIKNIDIFNACHRKNPKTGVVNAYDREWLDAAVAQFKEEKARGYLPPVHVDHHAQDGTSRKFAGHIGDMWVEKNGDGIDSLFADIVDIPKPVMGEIVKNRIPYRSIEVNDPNSKKVSSLAIMATLVPFHHLPLTRVTMEDGGNEFETFNDTNSKRVLFMQDAENHVAIVQHFNSMYRRYDDSGENGVDRQGRGLQYADGEDGGKNNIPQNMQDGEGDDLLTDEDLAELLAMLGDQGDDGSMMGQPQDDGMGEGSDYGGDPSMLDQGMMGEPSPDEQAELGDDGLMALAPLLQQQTQMLGQVAQTMQRIESKLEAQESGNMPSNQAGIPTMASQEDTTQAQQFAEKQARQAQQFNESVGGAIQGDPQKIGAALEAIAIRLNQMDQRLDFMEKQREYDAVMAQFSEQINTQCGELERRGYNPENIQSLHKRAWEHVDSAIQNGATPDVATWFSEMTQFAGPTNSGGNGTYPPTNPNPPGATRETMTEATLRTFAENDKDLKVVFAESGVPATEDNLVAAKEAAETWDANKFLHSIPRREFVKTALSRR